MIFDRILMVCVGNICRSPMAAGLLAQRLRSRGLGTKVESAGIAALVGRPADPTAVALMAERGVDLSAHRARQLTEDLIRSFELIVVMDTAQQKAIEGEYPMARGRVHRIGRFGGFDVPDPYRRERAAFEASLALIERGVADLENAMCVRRMSS